MNRDDEKCPDFTSKSAQLRQFANRADRRRHEAIKRNERKLRSEMERPASKAIALAAMEKFATKLAPRLHIYARCTFDQVWADLEAEEKLHEENIHAFREWCVRNGEFESKGGEDPGPKPRIAFPMIYYAMQTCWWGHSAQHIGALPSSNPEFGGMPCDPRGAVLMQTDTWRNFLTTSREKHEAESPRFGLARFMAGHHLNAFNEGGAHWSANRWIEYEAALQQASEKTVIRLRRASVGAMNHLRTDRDVSR